MVEWGNFWAKAITMRDYKKTEAFVGLFSQVKISRKRCLKLSLMGNFLYLKVGELYNVKHVWCYDSLEDRKHVRSVTDFNP
jgi:hypothetical protein